MSLDALLDPVYAYPDKASSLVRHGLRSAVDMLSQQCEAVFARVSAHMSPGVQLLLQVPLTTYPLGGQGMFGWRVEACGDTLHMPRILVNFIVTVCGTFCGFVFAIALQCSLQPVSDFVSVAAVAIC